jgi:hypothetical protein
MTQMNRIHESKFFLSHLKVSKPVTELDLKVSLSDCFSLLEHIASITTDSLGSQHRMSHDLFDKNANCPHSLLHR